MLKVYPGSKVPTDGILVGDSNHINQSMITNGTIPMSKKVGGTIIGVVKEFQALYIISI